MKQYLIAFIIILSQQFYTAQASIHRQIFSADRYKTALAELNKTKADLRKSKNQLKKTEARLKEKEAEKKRCADRLQKTQNALQKASLATTPAQQDGEEKNNNLIKEMRHKYELGTMHYFGENVPQDYTRAFGLFSSIHISKLSPYLKADVQRYLGIMHCFGQGVKQDYKKAFNFLSTIDRTQLSSDEKAYVEYYLAMMYCFGRGVPQNRKMAFTLFSTIDLNQLPPHLKADTQYRLGIMYNFGLGAQQNANNAFDLFSAIDLELLPSLLKTRVQCYLGIMYNWGQVTPQNNKKSLSLLSAIDFKLLACSELLTARSCLDLLNKTPGITTPPVLKLLPHDPYLPSTLPPAVHGLIREYLCNPFDYFCLAYDSQLLTDAPCLRPDFCITDASASKLDIMLYKTLHKKTGTSTLNADMQPMLLCKNGQKIVAPSKLEAEKEMAEWEQLTNYKYVTAYVYDKNGSLDKKLILHKDYISCLALQGSCIITGSYDGSVRIWNGQGECISNLNADGPISCVISTPDYRIICGRTDGVCCAWSPEKPDSIELNGHAKPINAIVTQQDKNFVTLSSDKVILWKYNPLLEEYSKSLYYSACPLHQTTQNEILTTIAVGTTGTIACLINSNNTTRLHLWDANGDMPQIIPLAQGSRIFDSVHIRSNGIIIATSLRPHGLRLGAAAKNDLCLLKPNKSMLRKISKTFTLSQMHDLRIFIDVLTTERKLQTYSQSCYDKEHRTTDIQPYQNYRFIILNEEQLKIIKILPQDVAGKLCKFFNCGPAITYLLMKHLPGQSNIQHETKAIDAQASSSPHLERPGQTGQDALLNTLDNDIAEATKTFSYAKMSELNHLIHQLYHQRESEITSMFMQQIKTNNFEKTYKYYSDLPILPLTKETISHLGKFPKVIQNKICALFNTETIGQFMQRQKNNLAQNQKTNKE